MKKQTPPGLPNPPAPLSGGEPGEEIAPSPDKGRAGEGLGFLPYNKNLTTLARENRKNPTRAEIAILNKVLRMRQFAAYKFLRQKPISNFIVDFYCSALHLVIEIDGDSHGEMVGYDSRRTGILNAHGLTGIRYTNDDVLKNIAGIYDDLTRHIQQTNPAFFIGDRT